ncbi:MAG TPA: pyridoxamine 5'-phosphate oxidase family protein [Candidatus Dormibacteraeota bacterium]|nr:pyridoxamine 5'-phosphate oxidase family protein [Candidatus Dormibacteraeota bacterium]
MTTPLTAPPAGPASERVRLHRHPDRAAYDRATVDAILDAAPIAHLGVVQGGEPRVLPTSFVRIDDVVYVHGARQNALLTAAVGQRVCLTVTCLDGLVLARSAFNHSMNYRSVVVLGVAVEVRATAQKAAVLDRLVDRMVPGRPPLLRPTRPGELRATRVLGLPLLEASAKVRTGPPVDPAADRSFPVWAGEVPLHQVVGRPLADPGAPALAGAPRRIFAGLTVPTPG